MEIEIRTGAAAALAVLPLTHANVVSIRKQFERSIRLDEDGGTHLAALAGCIFRHSPAFAPVLARELTRRVGNLGGTPREALVKAAQRSGYLIIIDHVIDPDGRIRQATKILH